MNDTILRKIVSRFLNGAGAEGDLAKIFAALRFRAKGIEVVEEIGHFSAHPEIREKGLSTNAARRFFEIMRFQSFLAQNDGSINLAELPGNFSRMLQANYINLGRDIVHKSTMIKSSRLDAILKGLLEHILPVRSGLYQLNPNDLAHEEIQLLKYLLSGVQIEPAFTDQMLVEGFARALKRNSLANHADIQKVEGLSATLSIYALSIMHACQIELAKNDLADTFMFVQQTGMLSIVGSADAHIKHPTAKPGQIRFSGPLFITSLPAKDWCEEGLLASLTTPQAFAKEGVEISRQGKLALI